MSRKCISLSLWVGMNGENIMRKNVLNYLPDLVEASFSGDNNSLESVILSMIRIMAKDSETKGIAEKLSKLLSKHQAGLYLDKNITRAFTIEKESSEIDLYVNRRIPTKGIDELILNRETLSKVNDLIISYRNRDKLESLQIKTSKKIILNGPPGTGKSSIGEALAKELSLELIFVNVPTLFSSYLGDSGKTITNVFSNLSNRKAIIVFDEFDSIAVGRGSTNDVGEMRRVVNSVLTSMDNWQGDGLLLATTNDKKNLDPAIWRRFDEKIDIDLPDASNRKKLWNLYSRNNLSRDDLTILTELSQGFSPAEIEIFSQQGLRLKVIKGQEPFLTILNQIDIPKLTTEKKQYIVRYLKKNFRNLATRDIADLVGISKSSVQRYLIGDVDNG